MSRLLFLALIVFNLAGAVIDLYRMATEMHDLKPQMIPELGCYKLMIGKYVASYEELGVPEGTVD
ncbi:MAG: hypothetical protein EOP52_13225 [Sphingobacteriales bacterium]|nr:MAG: hypothetical protein EOP52_13225 [Sphingobacteriales bacterium]